MFFGWLPAELGATAILMVAIQMALNPILLYRIENTIRLRPQWWNSITLLKRSHGSTKHSGSQSASPAPSEQFSVLATARIVE